MSMLAQRTLRMIIQGAIFEAHARNGHDLGDDQAVSIANAVFVALKSAGVMDEKAPPRNPNAAGHPPTPEA